MQKDYGKIRTSLMLVAVLLAMSGCGRDSAIGSRGSIWNSYDVRHPVPYESQVPVSRATTYDRYQDNDDFYTAPKTWGTCEPGDPGCE